MAYIFKKTTGNKQYYYLRISERRGSKVITKDVAYLGTSIDQVKRTLEKLPSFSKEIRASRKKIDLFLEKNYYLEKVKKKKLKHLIPLSRKLFEEVEACKLHWQKVSLTRDVLTQQEFLKQFVIELAFNTTSIEGNTITLKEAEKLLLEQRSPPNRELREIYDVQNTEKVFLLIVEKPVSITKKNVITIHKDLLTNVDKRVGFRTANVRVFKSRFSVTPFQYINADINLLVKFYKKYEKKIHPLFFSAMLHHKFEKIHPFFDGNGRTGRMLLNNILLKKKYPPIIVRKKRREDYLQSLQESDNADITETDPKKYEKLIIFLAEELVDQYWSNFL